MPHRGNDTLTCPLETTGTAATVATAGPVATAAERDRGPPAQPHPASPPLCIPRFVNVASLNVRHTPSISGELIMTLPRGTALRVLERREGWLLVDLNPTLEGWVAERLTTTQVPQQRHLPPASLTGSR